MSRVRSVTNQHLALCVSVLLISLSGGTAIADDFPNRPIRVIHPATPGGIGDVIVRLVGEKLNAKWGQPVVLENRPGGNGLIGISAVIGAKPDGYTLLWNNAIAQNRLILKAFTVDLINDLDPVVEAVRTPIYLVTRPNAPYKDLREFINYAKANPGKVNVGTAIGLQLDTTILFKSLGIEVTLAPYPGSGSLPAALLSESVDVVYVSLPPIKGFLADDRARALAVVAATRSNVTPEIVAVGELYPGVAPIEVLSGFWAPKGTPKEVVAKLNAEINAILKSPEVSEKLLSAGTEVRGGTPEGWKAAQEGILRQFKRATDTMGLQPQ